jgi:hypothetical protein
MGFCPNSFFKMFIFACVLIHRASGVFIPPNGEMKGSSKPELDSLDRTSSTSSPADIQLGSLVASSVVSRSGPANNGGKRPPPVVVPNSSPSVPLSPAIGSPSISGLPNVSWSLVGTDGESTSVGNGNAPPGPTPVFNHPEIVIGQGGVAPSYMSDDDVRLDNPSWSFVWADCARQYRSYWTRTYVALLRQRNPAYNYIVCYDQIKHQVRWNGTQHVDWDVTNQDVTLGSGSDITSGSMPLPSSKRLTLDFYRFNVYYGQQGWFKRIGDGGYINVSKATLGHVQDHPNKVLRLSSGPI